jgi:hypothetical protein
MLILTLQGATDWIDVTCWSVTMHEVSSFESKNLSFESTISSFELKTSNFEATNLSFECKNSAFEF